MPEGEVSGNLKRGVEQVVEKTAKMSSIFSAHPCVFVLGKEKGMVQ